VGHNGADAGYRSAVVWFPDQQLGIAVLANLGSINPSALANRVAEVYLESEMKPIAAPAQPPVREPVRSFDPADLGKYAGTYWSDELETQYAFVVRDGKLYADHAHHGEFLLTQTGPDQFRTSMWFTPEVKFVPGGVVMGGGRLAGVQFTKK
jgi:hypothetical protein